jgi:hypothetical protein
MVLRFRDTVNNLVVPANQAVQEVPEVCEAGD